MTLAETIKKLRSERGLSSGQLAKLAGVSRGYVWQLENGSKTRPTLDVLQRLANALGVEVAEFCETTPTTRTPQDDLPSGLAEFVKTRGKALGVLKGDIESMKNIQFRGKQPDSPEDWEYLFLFLKRWAR